LLISSMVISATSLRDVSDMAMVPDKEWRIPTLIGSLDSAPTSGGIQATVQQVARVRSFKNLLLFMGISLNAGLAITNPATGREQTLCHPELTQGSFNSTLFRRCCTCFLAGADDRPPGLPLRSLGPRFPTQWCLARIRNCVFFCICSRYVRF
jgi:hypothetical protein